MTMPRVDGEALSSQRVGSLPAKVPTCCGLRRCQPLRHVFRQRFDRLSSHWRTFGGWVTASQKALKSRRVLSIMNP